MPRNQTCLINQHQTWKREIEAGAEENSNAAHDNHDDEDFDVVDSFEGNLDDVVMIDNEFN